jgi:hypothetical protein
MKARNQLLDGYLAEYPGPRAVRRVGRAHDERAGAVARWWRGRRPSRGLSRSMQSCCTIVRLRCDAHQHGDANEPVVANDGDLGRSAVRHHVRERTK